MTTSGREVAPAGGRRLRAAAIFAALIGVVGTLAFLLHAGQRTPRFLLVIMAGWVLSPYLMLAVLARLAKAWAPATRAALHRVTIFAAVATLVVYAVDSVRPLSEKAALAYVLVPPVAWGIIAIALIGAARASGRRG